MRGVFASGSTAVMATRALPWHGVGVIKQRWPPGTSGVAGITGLSGQGVIGVLAFCQTAVMAGFTLTGLGIVVAITSVFPEMRIMATAAVARCQWWMISRCTTGQATIVATGALALHLAVIEPMNHPPGLSVVAIFTLIA